MSDTNKIGGYFPPNNPLAEQQMRDLCRFIKSQLPPDMGFIVLVTPFPKKNWKPGDTRLQYGANITRETAINSMKEFLLKCGAAEDWMKHI